MRIAQVIKAKKLKAGDHVLIFNADGEVQRVRVVGVRPEYETGWFTVGLEGRKDAEDIEGRVRVVVWR